MHRHLLLAVLASALGWSQAAAPRPNVPAPQQQQQRPTGTLKGSVLLQGSDAPVEGAQIQITFIEQNNSRGMTTKPDGSYEFLDIPAGRYRIMVARRDTKGAQGAPEAQFADVPAKDIATVKFKLPALAQVSGRVLDSNRQPVPNVEVTLINVAYGQGLFNPGSLIYQKTHITATTNDLGEYVLAGLESDHEFLLYVDAPANQVRVATSDVPEDPALRRPIFAPTFYPNAIVVGGSQRVRLRAGEEREGVDIRMVTTPSYCISGTAAGAASSPSVITITSGIPTSGSYSDQVTFRRFPQYDVPTTGKFRICGLTPYAYTMYIAPKMPNNPGGYYGSAEFTITDNLPVINQIAIDLQVETVWAGQAPEGPAPQMTVAFGPTRGSNTGAVGTAVTIPGKAVVNQLRPDAYRLLLQSLPPNTYIKEVTYGNKPGAQESFTPSNDASMVLRIALGRDGGSLNMKVADRNGPVAGISGLLIPAFKSTPADLSRDIWECPTKADGTCRDWRIKRGGQVPGPIPPGKYYVLAVNLPYNASAEANEMLARALPRSKTVTIEVNGKADITIEPMELK
jgi:hypothetical protein